MGRQVSVTKLKEQIEAAKRGLAKMSREITAADSALQSVAMPAANFVSLDGWHENNASDARDQNMVPSDDMPISNGFQFFHRPKRVMRPVAPASHMNMANTDINARDDDQPLFQKLDQRLNRLEDDIAQNREHILELITLLSGLDTVAKPNRQNSALIKYLLRRYLSLFVIGFLIVGWVALTRSDYLWINRFLGLI